MNSGTATAGIVSPKGGATFGPWKSTEFYLNAGTGFHSNNALGTTITRDTRRGTPVDASRRWCARRAPKSACAPSRCRICRARCRCGRCGWVGAGLQRRHRRDRAGAGEQALRRRDRQLLQPRQVAGVRRRCVVVACAVQRASIRPGDMCRKRSAPSCPAGASVDNFHRTFGSLRLRYFGPRALVEDNSVRSKATTLVNLQGGISVR